MREALLQVKEELGPEALILRTQKIKGTLLGGSERWEVTAGLEDRFFEKPSGNAPAAAPSYGPGTRRIQVQPAAPESVTIRPAARVEPATGSVPIPPRDTTAINRDEFRALQEGIESVRRAAEAPTQAIAAVRQDLGQLRSVVSLLADHWKEQPGGLPVSAPLLPWYQKLLKADFAEDLARETCEEASVTLRETGRDDPAWVRTVVLRALAGRLPCAPLRFAKGRGSSRVLFAGPTGVGKTTTLMKLAIRLSRQDGISVGVVGCDSYRIGAQEQIKTFCDVAGLPLRIVFTDGDLESALRELADLDVVLIDTAGRSPANQVHFLELSTLVERIKPSDLILVQSATTRLRDLTGSVRAYRDLGPSRLVFTKIDETETHGAMCTLAARERIPVTALCFGQEIPEAMSEAAPDELARMLLGDEDGQPA
jgi:flagellar biosynthesis protein FlhF